LFLSLSLTSSPISDVQLITAHFYPRKITIANDCGAFLLDLPIFPAYEVTNFGFPGKSSGQGSAPESISEQARIK
jgi:hypothetical protein